MSKAKVIAHTVAIADSEDPTHVLKPNADGSLPVVGSFAAAPTTYQSAGAGQYGLALDNATAIALTPPVGAKAAQISLTGANARYRDDAIDPTSAVGIPILEGTSWLYLGPLASIKFITQAGNATLDVSYYK